jgi:tRNA(Ile)-lysidine synthase
MLRLGRGSGVDGLAAMAPVSENADLRLLRPLLDIPRDRLKAYLRSRGVDWVSDPSNEDASFARVRMRRLLPELGPEGLTEARLAATARRMGRARAALESAATDLLARAAAIFPEGYAVVSPEDLLAASPEVGLRALARLLACVGGKTHSPRLERLERLYEWLADGKGGARTLNGCIVARRGCGRIVLCREPAAVEEPVAAGRRTLWDGRFLLESGGVENAEIGSLGAAGWSQVRTNSPGLQAEYLPQEAQRAIPAVWRLEQVVAVPHFHYRAIAPDETAESGVKLTFQPARSLGPARFSDAADYA